MNCKECREIVLADYTDGELAGEAQSAVDAHLSACAGCLAFAQKVKSECVAPLEASAVVRPPEFVWQNIQTEIEAPEETCPPKGVVPFWPRFRVPSLSFGALALVLAAVLASQQSENSSVARMDEFRQEIFYFASIMESEQTGEAEGYGTAIEEYFL